MMARINVHWRFTTNKESKDFVFPTAKPRYNRKVTLSRYLRLLEQKRRVFSKGSQVSPAGLLG
jgi:hypothetical protein